MLRQTRRPSPRGSLPPSPSKRKCRSRLAARRGASAGIAWMPSSGSWNSPWKVPFRRPRRARSRGKRTKSCGSYCGDRVDARQMDRTDRQEPAWAFDPCLRRVGAGAPAVPDGKRRGRGQCPVGNAALADRWQCRGSRKHARSWRASGCRRQPASDQQYSCRGRWPWMQPIALSALRSTHAGSSRVN